MMASELRRRKKKSEPPASAGKTGNDGDSAKKEGAGGQKTSSPSNNNNETMWQTFSSHPLIRVAPIILIPYLLYRSYFYIFLQHPEVLSGFVSLRPAVGLNEERQILIVGTMSSGTVQVASELHEKLRLEVAHEASDTYQFFCRDGTVSWFHGVRFFDKPSPIELARFCFNFTGSMGFHPSMYRSTSNCSSASTWNKCWALECVNLLNDEWGCGDHCQTPYRRILHQVRHPLRTVESLVTKFCVGGIEGSVHPSASKFMDNLFPHMFKNDDTCIELAIKYVLECSRAMLEARRRGWIMGMYQIENISPCQIAELAGLTNTQEVVYAPNYEKIQSICSEPLSPAREKIKSTRHQVNKGQLELTWDDLKGSVHGSKRTNDDLAASLRDLCIELGYDPDKPEQHKKEIY